MNVSEYRKLALRAALDPSNPRHSLPSVPLDAKRILEVGCHAGQILEALRLPRDCEVYGCDVDAEALDLARQFVPNATFSIGKAEQLPYKSASFDFVFARSVMFVVDIPSALSEFSRVLKSGGKIWLSLHRWNDCRFILRNNLRDHPVKTLPFGGYTLLNSLVFRCTGNMFRYPLNRARMMSFQSETRMRKELKKASFQRIIFSHGRYLVVEAEKFEAMRVESNEHVPVRPAA